MDKYVFHGSPFKDIRILKPKPSEVVNNESVVFAGSRWIAVSNVRRWNDSDIVQGVHNDRPYMQEVYKDAFNKVYNTGGYLYTLPGDTFRNDDRLGDYEFISSVEVKPIKMEYIAHPLKYMAAMGVTLIPYTKRIRSTDWK